LSKERHIHVMVGQANEAATTRKYKSRFAHDGRSSVSHPAPNVRS
jgi:hypothetical protein